MKSTFIIFTLFLLFAFSLADVIPLENLPKLKGTTSARFNCRCITTQKCKEDEVPVCQIVNRRLGLFRCICIKKRKNYLPNKK